MRFPPPKKRIPCCDEFVIQRNWQPIALSWQIPRSRIGGAAFLLYILALVRMSVTYLAIVTQECGTSYIDEMILSGGVDNLLIFAF